MGGSNKMAAGRVPLLLFIVEAGMGVGWKQQNGRRPGLIVAFYRGSRNGTLAEAAKWPQTGFHCCFLKLVRISLQKLFDTASRQFEMLIVLDIRPVTAPFKPM